MFETIRAKLVPLMVTLTAVTFSPGSCSHDLGLLAGASDDFGYVSLGTGTYHDEPYVVEEYYEHVYYEEDYWYEETYVYDDWGWYDWWW